MIRALSVIGHGTNLIPHYIKHYSPYVDEIQFVVYQSDVHPTLIDDVKEIIKDYDNLREVAAMRQKAVSMNYDSLLRAHGGRGFIKRILDSRMLSSKELLEKVDREMEVQTAFMRRKYDEVGRPLFAAIPEVKQSYKTIEMLERHRSEILAWQRDLEQKIYQPTPHRLVFLNW